MGDRPGASPVGFVVVVAPRQRDRERARPLAAPHRDVTPGDVARGRRRLRRLRTPASAAGRGAVVPDSLVVAGALVRAGQGHVEALPGGVRLLLAADHTEESLATDPGTLAAS